ncbi:MAG: tetratricopeptide repeat protein [Chitinivibrionales bacterium]|nr:tetratricopeptide repeat protein [Chitinivibrionales bacterium]
MENSSRADTPLELYEKAYKLHYQEYKIAEACAMYRELIDKFPDSQECGYAVVQLNKIESNKVAKRLLQSSTVSPRISYAALTVSIVALVITISVIIIFSWEMNTAAERMEHSLAAVRNSIDSTRQEIDHTVRITRSLGALFAGKDDHALEILRNVQSSGSRAISSYTIAADIYLQKGEYDKAIQEYQKLQADFPELEFISDKIALIKNEMEPTVGDTAEETNENASAPARSAERHTGAVSGSGKPDFKKSLLVVDSVEFF